MVRDLDTSCGMRAPAGRLSVRGIQAPELETLEPRIMLSGTSEAFPTPMDALGPSGSVVYIGSIVRTLGAVGETDSFSLDLDAGQTVSVLVTPDDPSLAIAVEILSPALTSVGSALAGGAGQCVILQAADVAGGGIHTIEVASDVGTGAYEVTVLLNAAVETELVDGVDNGTTAGAQWIVDSVLSIDGEAERLAVVGLGEGASDTFGFSLDAGDYVDLVLGVEGGAGAFGHVESDVMNAATAVAMGHLNSDAFADAAVLTYDDSAWPETCAVVVLTGNGDGTFSVSDIFELSGRGEDVAIGDLDGDGAADIVVAYAAGDGGEGEGGEGDGGEGDGGEGDGGEGDGGEGEGGEGDDGDDLGAVAVFLNDGAGEFGLDSEVSVDGRPVAIALADMDGDDVPDVIVAEAGVEIGEGGEGDVSVSSGVSVLVGSGDGTFAPALRSGLGSVQPSGMAVGDVNGDEAPDVAIAGGGEGEGGQSNVVSVLLGNGDGTLTAGELVLTAGIPTDVALGDLDGDDNLDLITVSGRDPMWEVDNVVTVQMGRGGGQFGPWVSYALGDEVPSAVAVGDLTGDGMLDIATANGGDGFGDWHNTVSVLAGDGTGAMSLDGHYQADVGPVDLAIGDVDGDGDADIVVANAGEMDWEYVATVSTLVNRPAVVLDLMNASGQLIALGSDGGYEGADLAIVGFDSPAAGDYYATVRGVDAGLGYVLVITRDADAELQREGQPQDISATGQALGHLAANAEHSYSVKAMGNDVLDVTLTRLWSGGGEPVSDFTAELVLRDHTGAQVATDDDHDGVLQYIVPGDGELTVVITATSGAGDYALTVAGGSAPAATPLVATAAEPTDGSRIGPFPDQYIVTLSATLDLSTLDAADLTIDGVPAASVTVLDGTTVAFDISGLATGDGSYTAAISAGAMRSVAGLPVDAFSATFETDSTRPTVLTASIAAGQVVTPGSQTLTVTFSDDLDESVLDWSDVWLVSHGDMSVYYPGSSFAYDAPSRTLAAEFHHLEEGGYTLYLLSSPTAFTDAFGNTLDGDADGTGGDPFVVDFGVDVTDGPFPQSLSAVRPDGSMIHTADATVGFHGSGDVDVFTLDLDAGQTLSVTMEPDTGSPQGRIELRDAADAVVAWAEADAPGQPAVLNCASIATEGTYSLRLSSLAGIGTARVRVVLNAALEAETAGDNDIVSEAEDIAASGLAIGSGRYAVIGSVAGRNHQTGACGVDHYRLDLLAGGTVSAYLASLYASSVSPDIRLALLNDVGDELALGVMIDGGNVLEEISSFAVPADGTYILRVSNHDWSDRDYALVVTRNAAFNIEPNDAADDAQPLQLENTAFGYVSSSPLSVEPDDFVEGGELTDVVPGVTLSVEGSSSGEVNARDTRYASTGYLGFGHGNSDVWRDGYALLRADFDEPVSDLAIDVMPRYPRDLGWLRAYNAEGQQIASVYSPFGLSAGEVHTLSVNRAAGDIAYITVGGRNEYDSVLLDALVVGTDPADCYRIAVAGGDTIEIATATPGDGPLAPTNNLDPMLAVYNASGELVAEDYNGVADGRNATLSFVADATGVYTVIVGGEGDTRGTYAVSISGMSTPTGQAPSVMDVWPPSSASAPTELELTFSEALAATLPPASVLTVGGVPATDVEFVDGRTLRFDVAIPDVEGDYALALNAAVVSDLQGLTNPAWAGTFHVDRTGPRVVSHSPAPEAGMPFDTLTFHFDEPIDPATVSIDDVYQFTDGTGQSIRSSAKYVTVDGSDITVHLVLADPAVTGVYSMTFGSQLADLAGNVMDQDSNGTGGQSADRYVATVNVEGPNLLVEDVELNDTSPHFGDTVMVTWTVRNNGTRDVEAGFANHIYLSLDDTLDPGDMLVATVDTTTALPLPAGATHTQTEPVLLELAAGSLEDSYYVLVATDAGEDVGELSEADNALASDELTILLNDYPNLIVTGTTVPTAAFGGQSIEVQWTVTNSGDAATASPVWYDEVYLSRDDNLGDVDDVYLGRAVNGSFLGVGESYQSSVVVTLPMEADETFYVLVMADAGDADGHNFLGEQTLDRFGNVSPFEFDDGQVIEFGHEDDNVAQSNLIDVSVAQVPDLQVTQVTSPTTGFTGQYITVSWTVENAGNAVTGTDYWVDTVYLSADAEFDNGDEYLGSFAVKDVLPVGERYDGSVTTKLPLDMVGTYYVFVKTNAGGQVFEHWLAGNNATHAATPIMIHLTPPPDLEVENASLDSALLAGQPVDVSYDLRNAGASDTRATLWREAVYASRDTTLETEGPDADILLGVFDRYGSLAPGEASPQSFSPVLPADMVGEYFFFVVTDLADDVNESDEDNNVAMIAAPGDVAMFPPDLQVTDSWAESSGIAGQTIVVEWTVTNLGVGDVSDTTWTDLVYVGDPNTGRLAAFECDGSLAVGESYTLSRVIEIPPDMQGVYDLYVETDFPYAGMVNVFEGGADDNNTSAPMPVTITRLNADLQVTSLAMDTNLDSGQAFVVAWDVRNTGNGTTSVQTWQDAVYLSADDVLDEYDILLNRMQDNRWRARPYETSEALAPGGSYSAVGSYLIPLEVSGTYYVILSVDDGWRVLESNDGNNIVATEVDITLTGPADLAVGSINAPADASSGTWFELGWTVTNNGQEADGVWTDAVWLTTDQVIDARVDYYLGRVEHAGPLAHDGFYGVAERFRIPDGLSGDYYVYVVTDSGNDVAEFDGEGNNAVGDAMLISLPDAIDLVAGTITVPVDGVPGRDAYITYRVDNLSDFDAPGGWQDRLYISADATWDIDDALFGEVYREDGLLANTYYTETVVAPLPGLTPGDYYVLLRSDVRGKVIEIDEGNNFGASLDTALVDSEELTLGTATGDALDDGEAMYYRIDVPAGETLFLTLDSAATDAANEMYVRFGQVPTRGVHDYAFDTSFAPDQQILVPLTEAGTYHVLLYGDDVPSGSADYEILAELIDFSAVDEGYGIGGTAGDFTIEINGAKFDRTVTATLSDGADFELPAEFLWHTGPSRLYATFDLTQATPGIYDVVISKDSGETYTVTDGLSVVDGGGSYVRPAGWSLDGVRVNSVYPVTFVWGNEGINDALAPMLVFEVGGGRPHLSLDVGMSETFERMDLLGAVMGDSPHGIIMPGQNESITMFSLSGVTDDPTKPSINTFRVGTTVTDTDRPLDWELVRDELRTVAAPDDMPDAEFESIFAQMMAQVGPTEGDFLRMLSRNATLWPLESGCYRQWESLLTLEFRKATATLGTSIRGQAWSPDFAVDLSFRTVSAYNTDTGDLYTTQTLNDGSFIFEAVTPGTYEFGYEAAVIDAGSAVVVGDGDAVTGHVLDVSIGGVVGGTVRHGATEVAGARLTLATSGDEHVYVAETNEHGAYSITGMVPGTYSVTVIAEGRAWYRAEAAVVIVADEQFTRDVVLTGESTVSGAVSLGSGAMTDVLVVVAELTNTAGAGEVFSTSSTSGDYALAGLPAGTYDLTFLLDGFLAAQVAGVEVGPAEDVAMAAVSMQGAATISGHVVSSVPGQDVAGLVVGAFSADPTFPASVGITDGSGVYTIENLLPGTYTIRAIGLSDGVSGQVSVVVGVGDDAGDKDILLAVGGVVAGTVTDESTGTPMPGIGVTVYLPDGATRTTTTDAAGVYRFEDLVAGQYTVSLTTDGADGVETVSVTAEDGTVVSADLSLDSVAGIGGLVTLSDGTPLADATVTLYVAGRPVLADQTDDTGRYGFHLLQPGQYELRASCGAASFTPVAALTVAADEELDVDFVAGAGTLMVVFADPADAVAGASVLLFAEHGGHRVLAGRASAGETGIVEFEDLADGDYRVQVVGATGRVGQANVTLAGGTGVVGVSLAERQTITGVVADAGGTPIGGAMVMLISQTDPLQAAHGGTLADGTYELTGVEAGTYDLIVIADGYDAHIQSGVVVVGSDAADVALVESTTQLSGTVIDAAGDPLPGGTVSVQDASGRFVGTAEVGQDGSYVVTTASGTDLSVRIARAGSVEVEITSVDAIGGQWTDVGATQIQPVAVRQDTVHEPVVGDEAAPEAMLLTASDMIGAGFDVAVNYPSWLGELWQKEFPRQPERVNFGIKGLMDLDAGDGACREAGYEAFAAWLVHDKQWDLVEAMTKQTKEAAKDCAKFLVLEVVAGLGAGAGLALALAPLAGVTLGVGGTVLTVSGALGSLYSMADYLINGTLAQSLGSTKADFTAALTNVANSKTALMGVLDEIREAKNLSWASDNIAAYAKCCTFLGIGMAAYSFYQSIQLSATLGSMELLRKLQRRREVLITGGEGPRENGYVYKQERADELMSKWRTCFWMETDYTLDTAPAAPNWTGDWETHTYGSVDPNDIIGPDGYGEAHWVPIGEPMDYTIRFENDPDIATAPAASVTITQQLDSDLDFRSFRVGDFGFGDTYITVPEGRSWYSERLDLTATVGIFLDVSAGIDVISGQAFWQFTSIDPATGAQPTDPGMGFLPPNLTSPEGQGFVNYVVTPRADAATGAVVDAAASIVFDTNEPMDTPPVFNTIDAESPDTAVVPLPADQPGESFLVTWGGADAPGGSALAGYTVHVATDGGAPRVWLADTLATQATFVGEIDRRYAFYATSCDNAGNVEAFPAVADAVTATPQVNDVPEVDLGDDLTGGEPAAILRTIEFVDPDLGDSWTVTIDYGDGSPAEMIQITTTSFDLDHTYLDDGEYTIAVTVVDNAAAEDTDELTVTVDNVAPAITSLTGDAAVEEGQTAGFSASASDPAGAADPLTYAWDFGDATAPIVGVGLTDVAHAFAFVGDYTVTLTVTDGDGGQAEESFVVHVETVVPGVVVGRHVFYNNSIRDGNEPAANSDDDLAIAADKRVLMPGQTPTAANHTSFGRGINGIMIDLQGLTGNPYAGDFIFGIGDSSDSAVWATAPAPQSITVRPGEGVDGSDRITLIWADNAIRNEWLRVTALSDANGGDLGLAENEVFLFGNTPADITGDNVVDDNDLSVLLSNWAYETTIAFGDITCNGTVDGEDLSILLGNWGAGKESSADMRTTTEEAVAAAAMTTNEVAAAISLTGNRSVLTATASETALQGSAGYKVAAAEWLSLAGPDADGANAPILEDAVPDRVDASVLSLVPRVGSLNRLETPLEDTLVDILLECTGDQV